ncbi:aspartate aminotransferase family protein [Cohnella sp. CFH 77786]|uniref:aspartate aminotransferase family protein n=1 Tax=Cohnella sp. CFH 77786 TaxID=2662265 RepID=UPI001C60E9BE|nr:aspartate aminotransferase family protein [Cohnella sp. CFH 77786]MBW5448586.1 aspartate aminotransferase family protein [Cohnella sp. CFH 77786]
MEREHLIKPLLDRRYPKVRYGQGAYLYDEDGKPYLDACSGAVTAGIGHGVEEIVEAMREQAGKVSFVYRSQFTSEPAERLAKRLSDAAPGGGYWSFFVNSGSEATETAMKIAIQHWQERGKPEKTVILSRRMSYHGITLGALSMSGHPVRRRRFEPLLEEWPLVAPPYCYRCPMGRTFPECMLACADDLEAAIRRIGSEHIAAFIAEPVVGAAGGAVVPPDGYYRKVKEICERNEILFIADEVMTGIARTGKLFGIEHWGVEPDLIALGKGLTAGYAPMAAAMAKDGVIEPILRGSRVVMSGHTFSANPLSAAVALAVLDYVEKHDLVQAAREKGERLFGRLREMAERCEIVGDVRGRGLLLGIEFVADRGTKRMFPPEAGITAKVVEVAFGKGLLVYPAAGGADGAGDAVIVAPPFTVTGEELDIAVRLLEETILEVAREVRG